MKQKLTVLVDQAKQGNQDAFAKLYNVYSKPVYYLALKMTKNEHDAKDIVQETMLILYNDIDNLIHPEAVGSYINKIAYNACMKLFNKDQKNMLAEPDYSFDNIVDDDYDFIPESYVESREKRETVLNALEKLHNNHRTILVLFYFNNLTVVEISEMLNISQQAVKNRLHRARINLRSTLEQKEYSGKLLTIGALCVLTRIMNIEAEAAFTPKIAIFIWRKTAKSMGMSKAEIAATSLVAVDNPAVFSASKIGSALLTKKAVALVAVGLGIAIIGVAYNPYIKPSLKDGPESENIVGFDDNNLQPYDGEKSYGEKTLYDESFDEEIENHEILKEAQTSVVDTEIIQENEQVVTGSLEISANTAAPINYAKGTEITEAMIIRDASITATGGAKIDFQFLDQVDTTTMGQYLVYVRAQNEQGEVSTNVAIIVGVI